MNRGRSLRSRNGTRTIPESDPSGEEVIPRGSRQRNRRVKAAVAPVDPEQGEEGDLSDLISKSSEAEDVSGVAGIVTDAGLDESDEDSASSCSSIVSGPSGLDPETIKKLCASCLMLYGNATADPTPVKHKLHDNDPSSLTCDQWVLLKKWTPRRGSNLKRKFLSQLQFDKHVEVEESFACSRLHPFLQRNLKCVTKAARKARGKKRTRKKDSQELCSAKQQRLNGEASRRQNSVNHREVASSSSRDSDSQADTDLSGETSSSSATGKTSQPKKARDFRSLLLQLRGNTIVKETQH